MDEVREKAKQDYMQGLKYKDICEKYDLSINTLKSWVKRHNWSDERKNKRKKCAHKNKRGAPKGNKNAVGNSGGAAPQGNINAIKHGAYQSIYADMLPPEEKAIYEQVSPTVNVDEEIRLLRLKIARLLNRERSFFYNMFGQRVEKKITEEDRENGILACMDQLRRLIETKATITGDAEKFEFHKYKTEIELQLKKEKLELEKNKVNGKDKDKPIEILIKRKGEE